MSFIPVWDRFIRLFHWGLVLAIAVAAITGFLLGADALVWHLIAGLAAAALVVARIVWGIFGPTHARFAGFVPTLSDLRGHLKGGARHLGHNPLGALMVLALLAIVLLIAMSGLVTLGGVLKTGPLAGLSYATGEGAKELHETLAIALLVLIGLHLAGVVFESRRSRENLARAMVTGLKETRPGDHTLPERPGDPLAATAVTGVVAMIALGGTALAALRPIPGAPVEWDAQTYAECSACHMAYHPSLLPAESWQALMADLSDHFGEDASLPPATTAEITAWLTAHAAATADTLPAHRLARVNSEAPFTLTETAFWERRHDDLPEALFKRKPIGSPANCVACHRDAETGWFSPLNLSIPKETTP